MLDLIIEFCETESGKLIKIIDRYSDTVVTEISGADAENAMEYLIDFYGED